MSEISNQLDAPPVAGEIQNIEIEVLPRETQVRLAPEMISGRHAAGANEETDSNFPLFAKITDQIGASTVAAAPASPEPVIDRIWPVAVIVFGLALTAAWMCLLGYALVKLIEMAI
jgi:hypothetical protein